MKHVLFFATEAEASVFVTALCARQCVSNVYSFFGGHIVITGIGVKRAGFFAKKMVQMKSSCGFCTQGGGSFCEVSAIKNGSIGSKSSAKASVEPLSRQNFVWSNFGIVGLLCGQKCVGDVVEIDGISLLKTARENLCPTTKGETIFLREPVKHHLYTSTVPIHRSLRTPYCSAYVDMEAYAIARVAKAYGIPFRAIKAISDTCTEKTSSDIKKNLSVCSKALLEFFMEKYFAGGF